MCSFLSAWVFLKYVPPSSLAWSVTVEKPGNNLIFFPVYASRPLLLDGQRAFPFNVQNFSRIYLEADCFGWVISDALCTPSMFISHLFVFSGMFCWVIIFSVCSFSSFSVTKYLKMGVLNNRNWSSYSWRGQKSKIKALAGLVLRAVRKGGASSLSVWLASSCDLLMSSHHLPSVPVCVLISSYRDTSPIGLGLT